MAVVSYILSGSSKDPVTIHLLQCQWLVSAFYQFDLHAAHIPCKLNLAADALSRNNLPFFLSLFPQVRPSPVGGHGVDLETRLDVHKLDAAF